jgi:hypothetical protein
MSRIGFQEVVGGRSFRIYPDRRWINPVADGTPDNPGGPLDLGWRRTADGYLDLDCRIWFFTDYYSISPGMLSQIPGKGAKYMVAFTDSEGTPLSGGSNYRLNLPPKIPAGNFWSVTLYEAENASGLANGQPFPSLGSRDKPAQNADGSTDVYLGPKTPRVSKTTGSPPFRARAISRFYGSTARPKQRSTRRGSLGTSRR